MTYKEIINQLDSIRDNSKNMAKGKDADEIWKKDMEALTEAIDIIADYEKATAQASDLIQRYEKSEMPIKRQAGIYTCPLCGKRTQPGHTHCHWCGKKLSWDRVRREARNNGKKTKQADPRAEPKKRTLVDVPRKKAVWTEEEEAYLQDKWGTVSIPGIAKALGRSEGAVVVRAQRLGCGAHLDSDVRISLNQLMLALYGGVNIGTHTNNRLIRAGLPVKWHRVKNSRFRVIDIDDFWKWAEQNKGILDFSRFQELSLGAEPEWVKIKRKADWDKLQRHGHHNAAWTKTEDERLIRMLKQHKYTYQDLAKELRHSEGAIKRRILDLKLKERPIRNPSRPWKEEEIETLCIMVSQGYDWSQIAEKVGRTAMATRGKYERLQNPDYMKRYNRGVSKSYEYQNIHGIDPKEVLDRHKAMLGLEFDEAPPEQNQYIKRKEIKQLAA